MTNQKRSRLLTTMVLAAAMFTAIGSEALAAGSVRSMLGRPSTSSAAVRPDLRPMAGEPDVPNRTPDPPKVIAPQNPAGQSTSWVLRIQWSFRVLLNQLPRL